MVDVCDKCMWMVDLGSYFFLTTRSFRTQAASQPLTENSGPPLPLLAPLGTQNSLGEARERAGRCGGGCSVGRVWMLGSKGSEFTKWI